MTPIVTRLPVYTTTVNTSNSVNTDVEYTPNIYNTYSTIDNEFINMNSGKTGYAFVTYGIDEENSVTENAQIVGTGKITYTGSNSSSSGTYTNKCRLHYGASLIKYADNEASLKGLIIGGDVIEVGNYCFVAYCNSSNGGDGVGISSLENLVFKCKNLTLDKYVFLTAPITEVYFEDETILDAYSNGGHAFDSCSSLQSIDFSNVTGKLGKCTINGCIALSSVVIPEAVQLNDADDDPVFTGVPLLITAGPIGGEYNYQFGWTTTIPDNAFNSCTKLASVTLPDTITTIGGWAFMGCISLASLTIPGSVTSIGDYAFNYCSKLLTAGPIGGGYNIEFGWTTTIPNYAFTHASLNSVVIPNTVTRIGYRAFYKCNLLSSIIIPDSVTSIGSNAFTECAVNTAGPIGGDYDYQFGWTTTIPNYAFNECDNLIEIDLPDTITTIGEYAFMECYSLTSIDMSNCTNLTRIGASAFNSCTKLSSVTIPSSVTSMGDSVFIECGKLLTAGPIGGGYNIEFGWTTTIPNYAFHYCASLTSVDFPDSITTIGGDAFRHCMVLADVDLSNCTKLTTIEDKAFQECYKLSSLIIPKNVEYIRTSTFAQCKCLLTAGPIGGDYNYQFGWTTTIPEYAFHGLPLTSITLPKSELKSIGGHAFGECTSLTSIALDDTNITTVTDSLCYGCTSLTKILVNDFVYTIEDKAFASCTSLTGVYLFTLYGGSTGTRTISSTSFEGCTQDDLVITIHEYEKNVSGAPWGATNATIVWSPYY